MNRDVCEHFNPVDLPCDKCKSANVQKSTLREAAQQALEAMEGGSDSWQLVGPAIDALRAALVEDAMQKFTDVNQELEAALTEPVLQTCNCRWDGEMQMQQCTLHEAHVDAIKEWAQRAKFAEKKLAALAEQRLTDMEQKMERSIESLKTALAEPVQEPVAWTYEWKHRLHGGSLNVSRVRWPESDLWIETPLYAAPPQRKPLTEEEIDSIWDSEKAFADIYAIVRAIERAHGIV